MSQINVAYVAAFLIFHSYVCGSHFYLRKCHEVKLLFPYTEVDFRKCICKTEVDFRKASEISRNQIIFSLLRKSTSGNVCVKRKSTSGSV